jgi:hypothetical protein
MRDGRESRAFLKGLILWITKGIQSLYSLNQGPFESVGSTSVLHWLHAIAQCNNSFLIVLCSTILNYIYHLCALEVVASGIDDIIVQTERGWFSKYSRLYNNWYSLADKSGRGLHNKRDWSYLSLFDNRTELLICDHWSVLVALRWLQRCICCIFVLVVILVLLCKVLRCWFYIYHCAR